MKADLEKERKERGGENGVRERKKHKREDKGEGKERLISMWAEIV